MNIEVLKSLFITYKETSLYHRYITNNHIRPLMHKRHDSMIIESIGVSVQEESINIIKIGDGKKKILLWSQMHGNESTTTKAIFDLINTLISEDASVNHILNACTLYIIPILNPDGAKAYTRTNANNVDLNRDAQELSQPESKVLRAIFDEFNPDFCYNLHGQRTIFSAGSINKPATVSFLAPAQDEICSVTPNRKVAMEVIGVMNAKLQTLIPNQVGVYDDAFNINCVGDTFQSENVPTILFEAGHFHNDYGREKTREYIYMSLLISLDYISKHQVYGRNYKLYFKIPENQKRFFDIIIRNAKLDSTRKEDITDIGILYQELLIDGVIKFIPKVENIGDLSKFYGHKEINAKDYEVLGENKKIIITGDENVCVTINNEIFSLLLK